MTTTSATTTVPTLADFAAELRVSQESLAALGVQRNGIGWENPERDAEGNTIGWAIRPDRGRKICRPGSKRGLTFVHPLPSDAGSSPDNPIIILEGATDTAAGIDLGLVPVGRPSATGGGALLRELCHGKHVVIIAENDQKGNGFWPGKYGAERIAAALFGVAASVRIIYPPEGCKDLRQWFTAPAPCDRAEVMSAVLAAEFVTAEMVAAFDSKRAAHDEDHRAEIAVSGWQEVDIANEIVSTLASRNDPPVLFMRAGELVRVVRDEQGNPKIIALNLASLRDVAGQHCHFTKLMRCRDDEGESKPVVVDASVPEKVLAMILSRPDLNLPPLLGMIESPTMRPDGSLLTAPGYDETTGLFNTSNLSVKVSESPSQSDAQEAADYVQIELLDDFYFDGSASKANMLGLLLTVPIRIANQSHVPMAAIDAPAWGSGKGLLAELTAMVGLGREAPLRGYTPDEAEMSKALLGVFASGSNLECFDNIDDVCKSATLARALTALVFSDRVLGHNRTGSYPNLTTFIATGNNLNFGGDIPRRVFRIRIDPHVEKPFERTGPVAGIEWRHPDLLGWATENRATIVSALLTMARAWHVAGRPKPHGIRPFGSFSKWANMIGGILEFAGVAGFLGNVPAETENLSDGRAEWGEFFSEIHTQLGVGTWTTKELIQAIRGAEATRDGLFAAMPAEMVAVSEKPSFSKLLGRGLLRQVDAVLPSGYVLRKVNDETGKSKRVQQWQIVAPIGETA